MLWDWSFIQDFSLLQIAALIFSGLCIGISKTAISGFTTISVPILAMLFGPKESTGIILPMMCFADILAVVWYRRNAEWKQIRRLLPWAFGGFVLALLVDRFIPPRGFRLLIGSCILAGLIVMIWNDLRRKDYLPKGWWFPAAFGVLGGFSTMIGNAAGPIMSVFLLSMHLPKESFVGTAAWFFLIINYCKMPLQIFVWHNITLQGILLDITLIPSIIAGAALGILLVKKVSNQVFRVLVYIMTVASIVLLLMNSR